MNGHRQKRSGLKPWRQYRHVLLGAALALALAPVTRAADTEIYFSSSGTLFDPSRSNVLLILDTSGSMNVPATGVPESRIDQLKEATTDILQDVENINVGLMRLSVNQGGPVLFPVTYLEEDTANVVSELTTTIQYRNTINDGANDVEDRDAGLSSNGQTIGFLAPPASTSSPSSRPPVDTGLVRPEQDAYEILASEEVVTDDGTGDTAIRDRIAAFLFDSQIPPNARISSARIQLTSSVDVPGDTEWLVGVEDTDWAGPLVDCDSCANISNRPISPRPPILGNLSPFNITMPRANMAYFPDITTGVQDLVERGCNNKSSDLANTRFETAGCTYEGRVLVLLRHAPGNVAGRFYNTAVTGPGAAGRRPRLTVFFEAADTLEQREAGLRFVNIRIPRDTALTPMATRLVLTPTSTFQGSNINITIRLEDAGNSDPFSTTDPDDLTDRMRFPGTEDFEVSGTSWVEGVPVEIDVTTLLQDLVNKDPGWCGGNAATFILGIDSASNIDIAPEFQSFENPGASPPALIYSYDPSSVPPASCLSNTENAQAALSGDDAEQDGATVHTSRTNLHLGERAGQPQTVGLRFAGVDVPRNATILEAHLEFFAQGASSGAARFSIRGLNQANPPVFIASANNIDMRSRTSAVEDWTLMSPVDDWNIPDRMYPDPDISAVVPDISAVVQELVNNPGWSQGGTMGFVIENQGSGFRRAHSFDGNPFRAPRLQISYDDTTTADQSFKTAREALLEEVGNLPAQGNTPLQEVMREALRYWRGEEMIYGDSRREQFSNRISHPGSYCTGDNSCGTALVDGTMFTHPDDPTGGVCDDEVNAFGVYVPNRIEAGVCRQSTICRIDPLNRLCRFELIGRTSQTAPKPIYISPISPDLTCSGNHQVLLTDGAANFGGTDNALIRTEIGKASCYTDNSSFKLTGERTFPYSPDQLCMADMAEYLATVDQSATADGDQLVQTSTIAYNLTSDDHTQVLRDVANLGQGNFYSANNAEQLINIFEQILVDVRSDSTSFVSPSLATNAFNRLLSRDEIYFGLFTPDRTRAWFGNVKKYNVCIDSSRGCSLGEILDANRDSAIDTVDSRFRQDARSIWSATPDGRSTTQGGSGAEITDYRAQTLYTDQNNNGRAAANTPLSDSGFFLDGSNWGDSSLMTLRSAICPVPSIMPGDPCEDRMLWLLGKKVITDAENDLNADQRWSVNDVLHSSPVVITYGGTGTTFYDKLIYGTNDGSLHFVNADNGREEWRFLPSDFWGAQQTEYLNPEGDHGYGMDTTPTLWVIDNNGNGIIEPGTPEGDSVRAFLATRRGGNFMYALDLTADVNSTTDPVVPNFLWRIAGGGGDFPRLGQTWSQPQITTISTDGDPNRPVLIFGGGWDPALDSTATFTVADNGGNAFLGNAIYIVDPIDGDLLLDISGSPGSDIVVPDMVYSIPSRIRLVDSNGNGDTDRLYVGDSGGQIFRVDLDPAIDPGSTSPEQDTVVGRLANVSAATPVSERRRFFEPPSVVQVRDEIYSDTAEYDYVLIGSGYRAHPLNFDTEDRFYAFRDYTINVLSDSDFDNVAESTDAYPKLSGLPFDNTDLTDVTNDELDGSDANQRAAAGWYFDFTSGGFAGEKVLSAATTVAGIVTFTTFRPDPDAVTDPCLASVGNANAYNFNILSAAAALDWDADGNIDLGDRKLGLGSGIPSGVVPIFTREGVVGIVGIEGGAAQLGVLSGLPRYRTYWYEEL